MNDLEKIVKKFNMKPIKVGKVEPITPAQYRKALKEVLETALACGLTCEETEALLLFLMDEPVMKRVKKFLNETIRRIVKGTGGKKPIGLFNTKPPSRGV